MVIEMDIWILRTLGLILSTTYRVHTWDPSFNCDFNKNNDGNALCGWIQDNASAIWSVGTRGTTGLGSEFGPDADNTFPGQDGNYIYANISSFNQNQSARLFSPVIAHNNIYCVRFYYNMNGLKDGDLSLYYFNTNTTFNFGSAAPLVIHGHDFDGQWIRASLTVSEYPNISKTFVFEASRGNSNSNTNYIGLDDISAEMGVCEAPGFCDFEKHFCNYNPCAYPHPDCTKSSSADVWSREMLVADEFQGSSHYLVAMVNSSARVAIFRSEIFNLPDSFYHFTVLILQGKSNVAIYQITYDSSGPDRSFMTMRFPIWRKFLETVADTTSPPLHVTEEILEQKYPWQISIEVELANDSTAAKVAFDDLSISFDISSTAATSASLLESNSTDMVWIASGLAVATVLFIALAFVYYRQKRKHTTEIQNKFSVAFGGPCYVKLHHAVQFLEVPRAAIEISASALGRGNFGVVYKGTVKNLRHQRDVLTTVAVKYFVEPSVESESNFISEVSIMAEIGRHLNIVNLLGVVLKGEKLMLLEFCQMGSLKTYLNAHRPPRFYKHVDNSGILLDFDHDQFQSMKHHIILDADFQGDILSTKDLISFSYQVARGMVFLAEKSIIHRDLAARNVLVCPNLVVKISDFGMAIKSPNASCSVHSAPVRWMAPESICSHKYSEKSDVWSYGVLLWEIFSLGETPYRNLQMKKFNIREFLQLLNSGYRMETPTESFNEIYDIMRTCWEQEESSRPTFSNLRIKLQNLTDGDYYLDLDQPYEEYNLYLSPLLQTK